MHMCQFRADGKFKEPLGKFLQRLANEPLSESLFRECFQMSYADMLKELDAYVTYPRHQFRSIKLTEAGRLTAADVKFRAATQGEIARIKGDAQRLAGREADALLGYRVAYARGERDPALLAALGVAESKDGQAGRAGQFLEASAKLGADRPSAYVALSRIRLDAARQKPEEAGKLSLSQTANVLAPLFKARALKPSLPETYAVMAEAWALSAVAPNPANVHVIGEGVMKFPFETELAYLTAELYSRVGDVRNATDVAQMGLRFASDAVTRSRFEKFLASLPASAEVEEPRIKSRKS